MGHKTKGTNAERQIIHMFFDTGEWAVCRSAGSGSAPLPNPDIVVGSSKRGRVLAIECKSVKSDFKYLTDEDIKQLDDFSNTFGAEAWFAIRFDKRGWYFLRSESLEKSSGSSFVVTLDFAKKNGLTFEELIAIDRKMKA